MSFHFFLETRQRQIAIDIGQQKIRAEAWITSLNKSPCFFFLKYFPKKKAVAEWGPGGGGGGGALVQDYRRARWDSA